MVGILAFASALIKQTDLVFVRHGETVANATGHYDARTLDKFSAHGAAEVVALTRRLTMAGRFDRILVSPSPRVMRTIAPYLRATGQRAAVWPLLYECCTGRRPAHARATRFNYDGRIVIPQDLAGLFVVDRKQDRYPVAADYDAGLAQVEASVAEFSSRFSGGRVLVVGHSGQGGHFLHDLTGKWIKLDNAREVEFRLR